MLIESLLTLKLLISIKIVVLFAVLVCSLSVILDTESYETLYCALENEVVETCRMNFFKKIESLPYLKVQGFNLQKFDSKSILQIQISGPFGFIINRHESLEIQ